MPLVSSRVAERQQCHIAPILESMRPHAMHDTQLCTLVHLADFRCASWLLWGTHAGKKYTLEDSGGDIDAREQQSACHNPLVQGLSSLSHICSRRAFVCLNSACLWHSSCLLLPRLFVVFLLLIFVVAFLCVWLAHESLCPLLFGLLVSSPWSILLGVLVALLLSIFAW